MAELRGFIDAALAAGLDDSLDGEVFGSLVPSSFTLAPGGELVPPAEPQMVAHAISMSRQMAVELGLVEMTDEERAQRVREREQYERWRRSWRGRWARLRRGAHAHRPVMHLGPCKSCDDY